MNTPPEEWAAMYHVHVQKSIFLKGTTIVTSFVPVLCTVYRLNKTKHQPIKQRQRHSNPTVADHLVMNGNMNSVSDACADLIVSVFRDNSLGETLFCLVIAVQSAKEMYSCSCLLSSWSSQLSALAMTSQPIQDSGAGSLVSGLQSETC